MVCDRVVVGGGGRTEEEEEEARDTESKTRTPHKVVGNELCCGFRWALLL